MLRLFVYFLLFSLFLGWIAPSQNLAQQSSGSTRWKRVKACRVNFLIPKIFKQEEIRGIDSCVAVFSSQDEGLKIDYGLYNSPFREAEEYRNVKKENVKIGGKLAELVTYTLNQTEGQFIAQIYVNLGKQKNHIFSNNRSLYVIFKSTDQNRMETAKKIFRSIRFN